MEILKQIEQANMKKDMPPFNVGDTVRVHVRVIERNLYGSQIVFRHRR